MLKRVVIGGAAIVALLSLPVVTAQRADAGKQVEWLYYGGDQGGTKYSTLTDVTPDNVQRLQIAWQWKHFDVQQHCRAGRGDRQGTVALRR